MRSAASKRVTRRPRGAAFSAEERPAGPAADAATVFAGGEGARTSSVSWQARGFTRQEVVRKENVWSRQAWLQPMQVLMVSGMPATALLTKSGSARKGLAMETMSAWPLASSSSAFSGVLMRLLVTSGTVVLSMRRLVTHA